jgi:hypothetical protein
MFCIFNRLKNREMNKYSFIVDLGKNQKNNRIYNQILICSCGNKQKNKITVKRTILKNTETLYEDKYSIDEIKCNNCEKKYNILNNLYGIKIGQNLLVEVSYSIDEIVLSNKKISILKKEKLYYSFDINSDELKNFTLTDFIVYDNKTKKINNFLDESLLNFNLFSLENYSESKNTLPNSKQNKLKTFDLSENNFTGSFFDFDETINYINLENCFIFFDNILKQTYDYDQLNNEKFLNNFRISSKISSIEEKGKFISYVNQKDPFGTEKLIKKRLNTGDYLNKLIKICEISCIFISFPSISTLYKVKGLDFVLQAYHKEFYCPSSFFEYYGATNTAKILELSCKNFYLDQQKVLINKNNEIEFKLSPLIIKNLHDPDDFLVLYKFYNIENFTKIDIENLFLKFSSYDIIKVMSKIISGANIRNVKLELKHIQHILKYRIYENNEEWLNIYYDTINTLALIVELLDNKENNKLNGGRYNNLTRISENKLFETKNFDKLKELHDEMFAIYRAMEDENKDIIFRTVVKKYKNLNCSINLFEFKVIPNLKELSQEGLIMKHCIYTYLNDIIKGGYLAIRVKDKISKEKATIGIKIESDGLFLQQLKGYENSRPTKLLINTVLKFCTDFKIIIDSNHLHKIDIQPNEALEKRMKNYLSKARANEIRKELN